MFNRIKTRLHNIFFPTFAAELRDSDHLINALVEDLNEEFAQHGGTLVALGQAGSEAQIATAQNSIIRSVAEGTAASWQRSMPTAPSGSPPRWRSKRS